ncbi:MAG: metal ABC transporter permease [Erysipelotrichaceae bacterium]
MFSYQFMQNALMAGLMIGLILPMVGIIILLRKMTFIADSFGHINMAGVALAILLVNLLNLPMIYNILITLIWTIISAILIEYLRNKYKNYKELSILIVYSLSVALTMIFLSKSSGYNASIFNLLFGNINGIARADLFWILIVEILMLGVIFCNYRKIILLSLDEEYSKLYGINVDKNRYLMMILIAITITIAIETIGVLLVSSLISIPLLASAQLAKNLKLTLLFAILITEVAIILGIILGFILDLPTSAVIVIITIIVYLISSLISKLKANN